MTKPVKVEKNLFRARLPQTLIDTMKIDAATRKMPVSTLIEIAYATLLELEAAEKEQSNA